MISITILSFFIALILVGIMVRLAVPTGMVDSPDERSSHDRPIATGAGVALVVTLICTSLLTRCFQPELLSDFWMTRALPLMLGLSVIGFLDDRKGLSARLRLVLQILAVIIALSSLGVPGALGLLATAGILLFMVWTMNAYNFMDGSNGMAAMQGIFTGAGLGLVLFYSGESSLALIAGSIAAACLGFLPWNAPKARIFMGDAGSIPLGFAFSLLMVVGYMAGAISVPVALLLLLPFHIDAGLTLLMRMRQGERWYTPHRRHVYQRLLQNGRSHGQVLLLYTAINGLLVIPGVLLGMLHPEWSWGLLILIAAILVGLWYAMSLKLGEGS